MMASHVRSNGAAPDIRARPDMDNWGLRRGAVSDLLTPLRKIIGNSAAFPAGDEETRMNDRFATVFNGILVVAIYVVAAFAIYQMPGGGQVAIHWGADNRPDAWISSSAIHLVNPVIALTIWCVASFFHQGFATRRQLTGTARARLSNVLLIQLIVQLLMALCV